MSSSAYVQQLGDGVQKETDASTWSQARQEIAFATKETKLISGRSGG